MGYGARRGVLVKKFFLCLLFVLMLGTAAVSYTHLDVYKRQATDPDDDALCRGAVDERQSFQ